MIVNLGVFYQVLTLCKNNFLSTVSILFALLVFIEPTLLAQTTSLNNDMLLLFFVLLSINSVINSKPFFLFIALTGLLLTNLRGIYLYVAILVIHLVYIRKSLTDNNSKILYLSYSIPVILFVLFCYLQFQKLGWFIITQNENYNVHRHITEPSLVIKNSFAFIKCFFDYGRVLIYVVLIPLMIKYYKQGNVKNKAIDRISIALIVYSLILFFGTVPFSNPIGDRYYNICYLLSILLLINLINQFKIVKKKLIVISIVFGLTTGHLWIYPSTISQAWDSSLAYLNYYPVEIKMEKYIISHNIDYKKIGTRIRLNDRNLSLLNEVEFPKYSKFNININEYILLSNIENYTKDEELNYIRNNWEHIKSFSQLGVYIALYKKK